MGTPPLSAGAFSFVDLPQYDRGMAKQTIVTFLDDLDGTEAAGTVEFALDRVRYDIDLSEANAAKLREVLAPYIAAGTKLGGRVQRPVRSGGRPDNQAIRDWAAKNGRTLAGRGRIPAEVVRAYQEHLPLAA